jgi:hypothetical protein
VSVGIVGALFGSNNIECNGTTKKLIRCCFRPVTVFCLVVVLFNSFNTVHAQNTHSWKPYFDYYEKGDCKKLLQRLKFLAKPKAWADNGLWSRSKIIQSKCHLQLGNYEEALKSIRLTPESKMKDAWLFQKIRILLLAS